jgi:membrane protease YdiL (CAAX protease family)
VKLKLELALVLGLSLGKSAVYSIVSLVAALTSTVGLGGSKVTINQSVSERPLFDLTYQVLGIAFSMVPVALCLFLLSDRGNPFKLIGFETKPIAKNVWQGLALAAVIGIPGLGLYLSARSLGLSAQIETTNLSSYWWTVPVLLLSAVGAALLEEVIMVGYLFERLNQLGRSKWATITISAAIRGSYHLYQGFGGFVGNFVMGIAFGWAYRKFGRLTPLVVAHFVLDAVSFVGYAWAKTFIAGL